MAKLNVNGKVREYQADPGTPLLWVLREQLGLTGTKYACGTYNSVRAAIKVVAWVVVRPDDTVVIRIARSEMGQGTLTGLAQMVAEELECNWAKVTTEYPTPGQNLARNRVWGNFSTGGSRGIRESQEYVRKGGATARMMLVQRRCSGACAIASPACARRLIRSVRWSWWNSNCICSRARQACWSKRRRCGRKALASLSPFYQNAGEGPRVREFDLSRA